MRKDSQGGPLTSKAVAEFPFSAFYQRIIDFSTP